MFLFQVFSGKKKYITKTQALEENLQIDWKLDTIDVHYEIVVILPKRPCHM